MAIQAYSLSKEGYKQLTPNFRVREFRCKDGSDPIFVDDALVSILQKIREHFGKALIIHQRIPHAGPQQGQRRRCLQPAPVWQGGGFQGLWCCAGCGGRLCRAAAARPGRHRGVSAQGGQGRRLGTHRHPARKKPVEGVSEHGKLSDF